MRTCRDLTGSLTMLAQILDKLRSRKAEDAAEPDNRVALAAATLLLEVAWADHNIAEAEISMIRRVLAEQLQLPGEEIEEVITASREHHDESVGLFQFTQTINDAWTEAEKYELVLNLWRLALADETIDRFEEHMIRKIAELLYVSHSRFIQAKRMARQD